MHRAIALAITVTTTVASGDPAPRPPTGRDKIVRIQRERNRERGILFCEVRQDRNGSCFGTEAPRIGDRMAVVDEHSRVAELRILGGTPKDGKDGACTVMWEVTYEVGSGSIDSTRSLTGVVGGDVAPTGHRMHDDGSAKIPRSSESQCRDDEQVVIGVDKDGDDQLDLAATFCTAGTSNSSYGSDFYVNIWSIHDTHPVKVQTITPTQLQPCLR